MSARVGPSNGRNKVLPARANRGNQALPNGYVDPTNVVIDDSDGKDSDDSEESVEDDPLTKIANRAREIGMFIGPVPAPNLAAVPSPLGPKGTSPNLEDDDDIHAQRTPPELSLRPLQLTIDVPRNHKGPVLVNIDFKSLTIADTSPETSGRDRAEGSVKNRALKGKKLPATPSIGLSSGLTKQVMIPAAGKAGFDIFPAELRLRVYRLLFKSKDWIIIGGRQDFSWSAQFLRTCQLVHCEGRAVLYGENRFELRRENNVRGRFFDQRWNEVGYEDCYRFLDMISAGNVSMLRNVGFVFDDALPSLTPDHMSRRYVHDQNLRSCLDLFAKHGQLKHIKFQIHGRRRLGWNFGDSEFLEQLRKVKANEVGFGWLDESDRMSDQFATLHSFPHMRGRNIELQVVDILRRSMVREVKQEDSTSSAGKVKPTG